MCYLLFTSPKILNLVNITAGTVDHRHFLRIQDLNVEHASEIWYITNTEACCCLMNAIQTKKPGKSGYLDIMLYIM